MSPISAVRAKYIWHLNKVIIIIIIIIIDVQHVSNFESVFKILKCDHSNESCY